MRKFKEVSELTTENILKVSAKCEYEVCVEFIGEELGLQDAGCLEAFLVDAGVRYLESDNKYYKYELENVKIKVPYEVVESKDEPSEYDSYLLFDKIEVIM